MTTKPPRAQEPDPRLSTEERDLGMDRNITRRDFINTVALGSGSSLLASAAPGWTQSRGAGETATANAPWHPWTGYAGVGDYARSNGNTWDVVNAGHGIRDSLYG